jgi:tetratricopeptide (TPR) repeat protein
VPAVAAPAFAPGSRFGTLRVERQIGRGAFATVYLAQDTLLERPVALKVLHWPEGGASPERDRALAEARLVGSLQSPHIVTLYRVHDAPGESWVFEMEYLDGGSLEDLLAREPLPPADRVEAAFRSLLSALQAAHESGVVHGDVKPGNLLLSKRGAAKLADFGLSRLACEVATRAETGELAGTPAYMAPEVIMGERASPASDLWSAGVVLYRMLAGRLPFQGPHLPAVFYAIQNAEPPPLPPAAPAHLAALAARCLAKDPLRRPGSCARALEALGAERPAVARAAPLATAGPAQALLGRDPELARIDDLLARAEEGRGATLLVTGDAGIGKTAFLAAAAGRARQRGFSCAEAVVTPVDGLLRPLLRGARRAWQDRTTQILPSGTSSLVRRLLEPGARIAAETRADALLAIEQLLRSISGAQPLLLIVEDAQDAGSDEIRMLRDLARRLAGTRNLLAVSFRTHDPGTGSSGGRGGADFRELSAQEGVEHLALRPLSPEAIYGILEAQAGSLRIEPDVADRVVKLADGNPRFAAELMRHLLESGAVVRRGGALVPARAPGEPGLPPRFHDLVALRVAGIPEEDRSLLDVAAVDGREFDGAALAAVLERPLLQVLRVLQHLTRERGLIVPQAHGYRFANPMVQEVLYGELAPVLRAEIHTRLAAHLESRGPGAGVDSERIGLHWERAGRADRALPHLRRAALEAARRQELRRAVDLATRAGIAPGAPVDALALENPDLTYGIAASYDTLGRSDDAERLLKAFLDAAAAAGNETLRLRTDVRLQRHRFYGRGAAGVDEESLRRAASELPRCGELGRALYLLGVLAKHRGELDSAAGHFGRADEVFLGLNDEGMHSGVLNQIASVALRRGRFEEAEARYGESARVAADAGRRTNEAIASLNAAMAAFARGGGAELVPRMEQSIRTLALEGANFSAAHATVMLGQIRHALGDARVAEETIEPAIASLREARYLYGLAQGLAERGALAMARGQLAEARGAMEEAVAAGVEVGERDVAVQVTASLALAHALGGGVPEGDAKAREALSAAETCGFESRIQIALLVAEGCLAGLPRDLLEAARRVLPREGQGHDPTLRLARGAIDGARAALAADGAPRTLRGAAETLRGGSVGPRRSALSILGRLFLAEAERREGRSAAAREEAARALAEAERLGDIWRQALAHSLLHAIDPAKGHDARRERLLAGSGPGLRFAGPA